MAKRHFVEWLRATAPYIHNHRGKTFVVSFGGETLVQGFLPHLVQDLALLHSLGIRLILVHGARPQTEARLRDKASSQRYHLGLRITDDIALACVKEAAATVRLEIESLLSMGIADSPMAGARIRVCSGNFVTARPLGIRDGIDFGHTGEVRRIDHNAISQLLNAGNMVLLSPLGFSPTGDVFNLSAEEIASAVAISLAADKLLILDRACKNDQGEIITHLTQQEAEDLLISGHNTPNNIHLQTAVKACAAGVHRTHLLDHHNDGSLLLELFTREGSGTLISARAFETLRAAETRDISGILELIRPMEQHGLLIPRSRERLEMDIEDYRVIERDDSIIGCAALHRIDEQSAELACLALHIDYQSTGRGSRLLETMEYLALNKNFKRLFVLTTQATQWFQERGYEITAPDILPASRQATYNPDRNSRVLCKQLGETRT